MPKATAEWKEKKPLYKPVHSSNPKKKGMVYVVGKNGSKKLIHFGQAGAPDFKSGTASKAQQKSYLARSAGIRDKSGKLTKDNRNSSNYWSRRVLW